MVTILLSLEAAPVFFLVFGGSTHWYPVSFADASTLGAASGYYLVVSL